MKLKQWIHDPLFWKPVAVSATWCLLLACLIGITYVFPGSKKKLRQIDSKKIPIISLKKNDGKKFSTKEIAKKKGIIVFWTTWCYTCEEEIKILSKPRALPEDWTLWIVNAGEAVKTVEEHLKKADDKFETILDPRSFLIEPRRVPALFISRGDGYIRGPLGLYDGHEMIEGAKALMASDDFKRDEYISIWYKINRYGTRLLWHDGGMSAILLFMTLLWLSRKKLKNTKPLFVIMICHAIIKLSKTSVRFLWEFGIELDRYYWMVSETINLQVWAWAGLYFIAGLILIRANFEDRFYQKTET